MATRAKKTSKDKTAPAADKAADEAVKAALDLYRRKRDFAKTQEPAEGGEPSSKGLRFVIQMHHARQLHYDFRLELDGTLKSWAVPKGPCLDPKVKRMAVQVEDHPLAYGDFEGDIPPGQYGAGHVIVWDKGQWLPDGDEGDARAGLRSGKLKFELRGHKLQGHWTLVRMRGKADNERQPAWLLIKEQDAQARALAEFDVTEAEPDSVRHLAAKPSSLAPEPEPASSGLPARRTALPATLAPQLATPADHAPAAAQRADWVWELKYDGYRLLTHIDAEGRVRCFTRNGHDWSARLKPLVKALQQLPVRSSWLDGEIIVEGEQGAPDFQALQNAFDEGAPEAIVYWLFDAPFLAGEDLRAQPQALRHAQLRALMDSAPLPPSLRLSEVFVDEAPEALLAAAAKLGFEGLIGKRLDAAYQSQRSPDWIKLKHRLRQEFVIGGYTDPQGARSGFGALMLGVYEGRGKARALRWCGNVGTGFDARQLELVHQSLRAQASESCPFDPPPTGLGARGAHWVRPQLVAEVAFGQWTREGRVRHAVFQGLREDKPASDIVREAPSAVPTQTAAPAKAAASGAPPPAPKAKPKPKPVRGAPRITHAERVIDTASGATKGDLVAWYDQAAAQMLPHLKDRPVALLRAPEGVGGELFFQKHAKEETLSRVRQLDAALDPGHAPLLQIDEAAGLLSLAQLNTIELHTWNARADRIAQPDRLCFDLDPGEGVAWERVQEGALLLRTMLEELGLVPFLKTSGGKGLHVVVPIRRGPDWDTAKGFAQAVVAHLARTLPERFVQKSGPKNRVGRIFVDYLRNGFGATTVCAWSVRARPGLGVSVPVHWDELPELRSGAHWGLRDAPERLAVGNEPWAAMARSSRALGGAMRALGYMPD